MYTSYNYNLFSVNIFRQFKCISTEVYHYLYNHINKQFPEKGKHMYCGSQEVYVWLQSNVH